MSSSCPQLSEDLCWSWQPGMRSQCDRQGLQVSKGTGPPSSRPRPPPRQGWKTSPDPLLPCPQTPPGPALLLVLTEYQLPALDMLSPAVLSSRPSLQAGPVAPRTTPVRPFMSLLAPLSSEGGASRPGLRLEREDSSLCTRYVI